jgi:hypothetical protein
MSDLIIATPACFLGPFPWVIFFPTFTLRPSLFFPVIFVSYKQQRVKCCFRIQLVILCPLTGN